MSEDREWIGATEVADIIGVTRRYVYTLVDRSVLPHYRYAGVLRFDKAEVVAWLERQKRDGQPAEAKGQGDG